MKKISKENVDMAGVVEEILNKKYFCIGCKSRKNDIMVVHNSLGIDCIECGYRMNIIYSEYKIRN